MPRRPNLFWSLMLWLGLVQPTKGKKKKKKKGLKKASANGSAGGGKPGRKPVGIEAHCRSVAAVKDDPWPARVREIKTGSISLLLTRRFEPGTLLVIELEKKEQSLSHTLVGRVHHAAMSSNGSWELGCTLANKIAEDDLQALLV